MKESTKIVQDYQNLYPLIPLDIDKPTYSGLDLRFTIVGMNFILVDEV